MNGTIDEQLIRNAPRSTEDLLELLFTGLDWPRPAGMDIEDIPLLPWTPNELHLDPDQVAKLERIQQLPRLTDDQPFGVFILTFEGGRLPIGAVRRLVNQLVRKKRAQREQAASLWDLEDLIFFCQAGEHHHALHVVSFSETDKRPVMKVISWTSESTPQRIQLVGTTNLPALAWPESGTNPQVWRKRWAEGFTATYRQGIRTAAALADQMAEVAATVRDEVSALYEIETSQGPLRTLYAELRRNLREDLDPQGFADMYAQTMVYGLLTARITNPEDFTPGALDQALRFENPLLDALYTSFREQSDTSVDVDEFGLHDLAETLASVDVDQVLADFGAGNRKDDPVVFFYEQFLERYDPQQRRELGTYYTPLPVVRCMIRAVDDLLKHELQLPEGIADATTWLEYEQRTGIPRPAGVEPEHPVVRAIDPATGTGTYLIEWLRHGTQGQQDADAKAAELLRRLDAFEINLSAYAVAHLKVGLELPAELRSVRSANILLTDTLAGRSSNQLSVFGDDPIAEEGQRARHLKFETNHSVTIANPPYDRVEQAGLGGWITQPEDGSRAPFADILDPARQNTIFSHHASLYNLYVYFWRWAIWKTFEQLPSGPGIVAYITASSWLHGPGFLGLRQLVRELVDDIYVIDLGGDNLGSRTEENVFPIQSPVAITLLIRRNLSDCNWPAAVHYHRVSGTREEKLAALDHLHLGQVDWQDGPSGWHEPLVPPTGADSWMGYPRIVDLFPWQQPGCKFGRTWPIAPDPDLLIDRWSRFVATDDPIDRAECFVTAKTGRNIHTQVGSATRLADLPVGAPAPAIRRYAYRSFDRQWALVDPRIASLERPALWGSWSEDQAFLTSLLTKQISNGPALVATAYVPDLDYYSGRGGKDVIPLYRDQLGTPNADPATLSVIGKSLGYGTAVGVESLFAYVYGALAGTHYTERFQEELGTPGPRVPLTIDPHLFEAMERHGSYLLWLHTYAERFAGDGRPDRLVLPSTLEWALPVDRIPETARDCSYDPEANAISVGDGLLRGVRPEVWAFEVSGMPVIRKWLGYRTRKGAGRSSSSKSPLDQIRPREWPDEWHEELRELVYVLDLTIELMNEGTELLEQICEGPTLAADALPAVPPELRKPPRAVQGSQAELR